MAGYSIALDYTAGQYLYRDPPGTDFSGVTTFASWLKWGGRSGTNKILQCPSTNGLLSLSVTGSAFKVEGYDTGGFNVRSVTSSSISSGTWYFVVWSVDMATGALELWVNNVSQGTATFPVTWTDSLIQFHLGVSESYNVDWFDGKYYCPCVYKRALTSGERISLYNSGNAVLFGSYPTSSLAMAYSADTSVVTDDSGNSRTLTNVNTVVRSTDTPYVAAPDPPTAGTLSLTSASVGSVVLGLATNTGGTPPYSNQLQRSNHGAGSWSNIGSPQTGATATLTDTTAVASGHYDYRVVVTDGAALTGTTNTVEVTVPSVVVPGALTAGASYANVALSLTGTTGGTAPYSNQLQRSAAGAGSWSSIGSPVAGASPDFNDQTAVNATAYDYRVAVSDSEVSPQTVNSATATITPGSAGGSGSFSPIGSTIIRGASL